MGFTTVATLLLLPWPLKLIIDHVMEGHPLPDIMERMLQTMANQLGFEQTQGTQVLMFACSYAVIALLATFSNVAEKLGGAKINEHLVLSLRDKVLEHFQTLSSQQRSHSSSGDLSLRILVDVHHLARLLTKTVALIFRHIAMTLFTLIVMFLINPLLALTGLGMVLVLVLLVRTKGRHLRHMSRLKRARESDVAGFTQEFVKGMDTIQALGAEEHVRQRFRQINKNSLNAAIGETKAAIGMERVMQIANGLAVALIMGSSGLLVIHGQLTLGELTVFVAYTLQLLKPVEKINDMASALTRGLCRAENLGQLLTQTPIIRDQPDALPLEHCRGRIELRGVSFRYPDTGQLVLDDVDLVLEPGRLTVLTGPSGIGKSTLMDLVLRQQEPTQGCLLIDRTPYHKVTLLSLRQQFGVMLQQPHLFAGSIRDALWLNSHPLDEEIFWHVLAMVNMDQAVRKLPSGLDTKLNEGGENLSGGQRARLSLARALLADRPILLLDEPLANIDEVSQQVIVDALERIRERKTIFAISHQPALIERADVILTLERGHLAPPLPEPIPLKVGVR